MTATAQTAPTTKTPSRKLAEAFGAFFVATALATALYRVHALDGYFHAIVAAIFLYLPASLLWREGHELEDYGLGWQPLRLNLLLLAIFLMVVFPLFFLGFTGWQQLACAHPSLTALAPGPCPHPAGARPALLGVALPPFVLRAPRDPLRFAAAELLVVALPEEFFFRGYLQARLAEVWPPARRIAGAPVGKSLVIASALFALCHVAVQGSVAPAAVFFPGLLFGWLRARTGSIFAGTLFHASCNVFIETLHRSYFG